MEAATPLPTRNDGRITVVGDRVLVEELEVQDQTLAEVVDERERAGHDAAATVATSLEIGARVLSREALGADVDLVKRELERVSSEVEAAFAERAGAVAEAMEGQLEQFLGDGGGALPKALEAHVAELTELVAQNFGADRSTAVPHQVQERVRVVLEQSHRDLIEHLSSGEGKNPLADFKRSVAETVTEASRRQDKALSGLTERLGELQTQLARLDEQAAARTTLAEAEERGTAKGRDYEEQVFEAVERIATQRGDAAFRVGNESAAGGGKRGDVVVEIDAASGEARGRFVIEAKDSRISKNEAWRILNDSMEQRDADFAILAVAGDERVPAGREALQEYEGNKLIVVCDREGDADLALEVAYRYARLRCLMQREQALKLDAAGVRDAAEEASSALKEVQRIRAALTGAGKNVDQAREVLDAMVGRVSAQLERIEALIGA